MEGDVPDEGAARRNRAASSLGHGHPQGAIAREHLAEPFIEAAQRPVVRPSQMLARCVDHHHARLSPARSVSLFSGLQHMRVAPSRRTPLSLRRDTRQLGRCTRSIFGRRSGIRVSLTRHRPPMPQEIRPRGMIESAAPPRKAPGEDTRISANPPIKDTRQIRQSARQSGTPANPGHPNFAPIRDTRQSGTPEFWPIPGRSSANRGHPNLHDPETIHTDGVEERHARRSYKPGTWIAGARRILHCPRVPDRFVSRIGSEWLHFPITGCPKLAVLPCAVSKIDRSARVPD